MSIYSCCTCIQLDRVCDINWRSSQRKPLKDAIHLSDPGVIEAWAFVFVHLFICNSDNALSFCVSYQTGTQLPIQPEVHSRRERQPKKRQHKWTLFLRRKHSSGYLFEHRITLWSSKHLLFDKWRRFTNSHWHNKESCPPVWPSLELYSQSSVWDPHTFRSLREANYIDKNTNTFLVDEVAPLFPRKAFYGITIDGERLENSSQQLCGSPLTANIYSFHQLKKNRYEHDIFPFFIMASELTKHCVETCNGRLAELKVVG